MCKVPEGDHAGSKSYNRRYTNGLNPQCHQETSDSDNSFSLPPVTISGGWDESDQWEDSDSDAELGRFGFIEAENGNGQGQRLAAISGDEDVSISSRDEIDDGVELGIETRNARIEQHPSSKRKRRPDAGVISCDPFGVPLTPKKKAIVSRPRRLRNKVIIITSVLAQMLFAHSRTANAFQTMMAAFNFASKTGKRANAVLNQLGLTVSPVTFSSALKKNASAAVNSIKKKIEKGGKPALFYDNLVIYDQKGEETEINKNRSLQLTVCAGYFLRLPAESAQELNAMVDPMLAIRALPASNQREILPVQDSSTLLFMDKNESLSWQMHTRGLNFDLGPENLGPETSEYRDLSDSEEEIEGVRPCPGIPTKDLFHANPD